MIANGAILVQWMGNVTPGLWTGPWIETMIPVFTCMCLRTLQQFACVCCYLFISGC